MEYTGVFMDRYEVDTHTEATVENIYYPDPQMHDTYDIQNIVYICIYIYIYIYIVHLLIWIINCTRYTVYILNSRKISKTRSKSSRIQNE